MVLNENPPRVLRFELAYSPMAFENLRGYQWPERFGQMVELHTAENGGSGFLSLHLAVSKE